MNDQQRYFFSETPEWVDQFSNQDFLHLRAPSPNKEPTSANKGTCYILSKIFNTSNEADKEYTLRAWELNSADILQGASIMEFLLYENQIIKIHRVLAVRDGHVIDKQKDLNVRILDEEKSSSYGVINNTQKLNCIIQDLRLGDILVFEHSVETIFTEKNALDKKYFSRFYQIPVGYWFYNNYRLKLLQNRDEPIKIVQRYFRDEAGNKLADQEVVVQKGGQFIFERENFQVPYRKDCFGPLLEMATDTIWPDISNYIYPFYSELLRDASLANSPEYSKVGIGDKDTLDEKIEKIIEYVQNQIVYLYDARVMHGHIPRKSEETFALKSGDCKAKSLLLINLLNTIGVKSELILVNYNFDRHIQTSLPSPFLFNHVIVKISYQDKDYFVDSTWTDRYGILGRRSEPFFSAYLPIIQNATLAFKPEQIKRDSFRTEVFTNINLMNGKGTVDMHCIYQIETANGMRMELNNLKPEEELKKLDKWLYVPLKTPNVKMEDQIKNSSYEVISDDTKQNILKTHYHAELTKPYTSTADISKIFRLFYSLNYDTIKNHDHQDLLCESFTNTDSIRHEITITSDMYVNPKGTIVNRNIWIDNDYFTFSNKKQVEKHTVKTVVEYMPKYFGQVRKEDLEKLRKDYQTINENFGVGIIFLTGSEYFMKLILPTR